MLDVIVGLSIEAWLFDLDRASSGFGHCSARLS